MASLQSTTVNGILTVNLSSGTMISSSAMTDMIGWNASYGSYIGSTVGSTTYIYGNGSFYDGSANRTLLHSANVGTYAFPRSGSWAADLVSSYGFTREHGIQMTGGSEFVVLSKSGQGYLLVDGSYYAAEGGGFYSTNNSSGGTLLGFYADTTTSLNFNTATVKLNSNQILHAGNYNSYALPLTGGTTTGMITSYTNLTNTDDWQNSPISIRERGLVGNGQSSDIYAPNLNFHWGNYASSSLWMNTSGHLSWGNYSGSGVPAADGLFKTGNLLISNSVGIGTTNAVYPLHVIGSGAFTGQLTVGYGSFAAPGLTVGDNQYGLYATGGNLYYKSASSGNHYWRNIANSANTMSLDNSGNLTITGALSEGGYTAYPDRVYTINLSAQSSSNFYPVVLDASPGESTNGVWHHRFSVEMPSQGGGSSYNNHTLVGEVRGQGWSDQTSFYRVFHTYYETAERSIMGIWRGTQDWYGVVVYLRGGQTYYVRSNSRSVTAYTSAVTLNSSATFAIKNSAGTDVSGTSANIQFMLNLITSPSGFYHSDIVVAPNMYASRFYDNDNSTYYLDPASTSILNNLTTGGIKGDSGTNYPHSFTNTDSGNTHWTNRNDRLLTSNGTNWATDGRDPIMALVTSGNSNATTIANSIGLALHNESSTDNTFSPAIVFSNRSNSTSYNTAYAAIIGRKTGQGYDSNWSAGELHFYTMPVGGYVSNIPSLIIDSAGEVGIGTTSPATKLQIGTGTPTSATDGIQFGGDTSARLYRSGSGIIQSSGGFVSSSYLYSTTFLQAGNNNIYPNGYTNTLILNSGNSAGNSWVTTLAIAPGGNVGIEVTSPTAKLDIAGSNTNGYSLLLRSGDALNGTDSVQIGFGYNNTTDYRHSIRTRHNSAASAGNNIDFYLWKYGTDSASTLGSQFVMTLQGNGNVGIGVTSPTALLDVVTATASSTALSVRGTNGTLLSVVDDLSDSLLSVNNSAGLPVLEVFADDRVVMGQYGQNDLVVRNNKVGIGVLNPAQKLEVNSATATVGFGARIGETRIGTWIGNTGYAFFAHQSVADTSGSYSLIQGSDGTSFLNSASTRNLYFRIGNSDRMMLNSSGNLGIGTTSPATALQIGELTPTSATAGLQFGDDTGTRIYRSASSTLTMSGTFIATTFSGSLNGNASTVTNGVYTNANNTLTGVNIIQNTANTFVNTVATANQALTLLQGTAGADAYITFHVSGDYAGYFGLGGAENDLVWGGWSVGNNRYRILHSGNQSYAWALNQLLRTTDSPTFSGLTLTSLTTPGLHAQWTLSGGGTVTWNGSSILWSNRIIAIPIENTEFGANGYIDINCPTSGTVTYYNSSNVTTTVTCTGSGIPLNVWEAVYYEVTPGQANTSDQTKFRVVNYQNSTWKPNSNWLLICARNGDSTDGHVKWIPGQINFPNSSGIYYSGTGLNNWESNGTTNYVSKFTGANVLGNSLIQDNGTNVGIGTSPAYKLDVNGACHASSFPTSSDARFKKNIKPIQNSLDKINKINGVVYEWNEFVHARRDGYELNTPIIGVIAQDLEKVLPEVVSKWSLSEDCPDARAVDYIRIIPVLIEAIKELNNKNSILEARILALENKQ